jgi:SAM-dependent methyltransferase
MDDRFANGAVGRYADGSYLRANPDWHVADSAWKARAVFELIERRGIAPRSICEVGCGAGEVLRQLRRVIPDSTRFVGYEISPDAYRLACTREMPGLEFRLGDAGEDPAHFDLLLLLDVVEHVPDPVSFLRSLRPKATWAIMHVPLELSLQAVARPGRLLRSRSTLGHLHFFTDELARATIEESGYAMVEVVYTSSGIDRPPQSRLARAARWPRRFARRFDSSLAARVFGGFALLVLARAADG